MSNPKLSVEARAVIGEARRVEDSVGYLQEVARENPPVFCELLGAILDDRDDLDDEDDAAEIT